MPRAKKTFDREEMYKRIMPSASRQEQDEVMDEFGANAEKEISEINNARPQNYALRDDKLAILHANEKTVKWINTDDDTIVTNIMEKLVIHRIDIALAKMRCCKCDRCRQDILAIALNYLTPHYIVCKEEELDSKIMEDEKYGLEVTSSILKAILLIRKKPRH